MDSRIAIFGRWATADAIKINITPANSTAAIYTVETLADVLEKRMS